MEIPGCLAGGPNGLSQAIRMYFPNFLLKHKYICLLTEVPH